MASEDADENVDRGTADVTGLPDGTGPSPAEGPPPTEGLPPTEGPAPTEGPPPVEGAAPARQPLDPKVAAAVAAAEAAGPGKGETVRIDSWIWAVRLIKTRSLGSTACRGGHVHVNGERVKAAYSVRVGDEVRLRHEGRERIVIVKRLIRKRVGAPVAAQCYIDNSPPPPPREAVAPAGLRDRGTGRPTKRDRRELERLRSLSAGAPGGFAGLAAAGGVSGAGGPGPSGGRGGSDGRGGAGDRGRGSGRAGAGDRGRGSGRGSADDRGGTSDRGGTGGRRRGR
ncbi:S4 domain-containing protein [Streptomyces sp. NPDC017095]|uniref:RNA-binding S4 domain-containing protein n=1 Tax=Streptomyces sp. NPDC017095 TaxID=3364977 RepID=UPI0037A4C047